MAAISATWAAIIFLRVIVLSCCDGALRSTPLQSMHWTQRSKSLLHIMVVYFSIAVMRALTPVSEETRLGGLYSAHAINGWSRCRVLLHSRLPRGGQKRTGETPALAHQRTQAVLMPEVAHPGEDHGEAGGVGGGDDFVVAQRAAGLDHGARAGLRDHLQTVGEGKEGV